MTKEIQDYKEAAKKLGDAFITKYYGKESISCSYWTGDVGEGILCVSDDFYNVDRMVEALKYKATLEQLGEFAEYETYCDENKKDKNINFKNFVKYGFDLGGGDDK